MNPGEAGKLCLVANTDWYLFNFRLPLAVHLRGLGWEVIMVSPPGPYTAKLAEAGFEWLEWQVDRRGLNLVRELRSTWRLRQIYQERRPRLVHHFTVKPVMYGTLAACLARVPAVVNAITGLGYIFLRSGLRGALLRAVVKPLYSLVIRRPNVHVIFENEDDRGFFVANQLAHKDQTTVIRGVGVDVAHFQPQPEAEGVPLVVMPARLLWDKGVGVLVEAVKLMRGEERSASIRVALVGVPDPGNPASIGDAQLEQWSASGLVEHWGFRQDMDEVYRQAHIVCLPSLREGLPTVLIEAAAAGKPIVASDVPGCREVVEDGINGLLVPPDDPISLARALEKLAGDPALRLRMGAAGRDIAVGRFANDKVIAATLEVYTNLLKTI